MGQLISLAAHRSKTMGQPMVTSLVVGRDTYRLLYRNQDLMDAERNLDGESMEESITKRGMRRCNVYLWAGLKHSQGSDFSIQKASHIVDTANKNGMSYVDLWDRISMALTNSGWLKPPEAPPSEASADPTVGGSHGLSG